MAKHESTAINDMIHLVHGRVTRRSEPSGPDPADGLFVTAPAPPAKFVPVSAHFDPCALSAPVPKLAPMPPPLPRRRAPNATPPALPAQVQPIFHDDEDDDEETTIDPNALAAAQARFANPTPVPRALPSYPQPILPHYAYPTPAPLPPAPHVPGYDVTDRMPRQPPFVPTPAPVVAAVAPLSYPVAPRPSFELLETARVVPLPPPPADANPAARELLRQSKRLVVPFVGVAALVLAVMGVVTFVHHGQSAAAAAVVDKKPEAPVVMAVTPPPPAPKPVVESIQTPPPAVSATGDAIGWKPQSVQPTFAAAATIAAPVAEDAEIEMDAAPVAKPSHHAKRVAVAARIAKPAAPKLIAPKPAKKERVAAAAPKADEDEITAAINAPSKSKATAATGPGKVTITSTPAALIYIDGRSLNQMTPKTLTLAPGQHKVTLLELKSRKAKTQDIEVAAGGSLSIAKKF